MPALLQLRRDQCRYPVTEESPWVFCGRATKDGSSYCARHHEICVKPGGPIRAIEFLADYINRTDSMSDVAARHEDAVRPLDEMVDGEMGTA